MNMNMHYADKTTHSNEAGHPGRHDPKQILLWISHACVRIEGVPTDGEEATRKRDQ